MITTGWTLVPFTQESLHEALRKMCPAALKAYDKATTDAMRAEWQPSNPTRFCCYFVSEMLYWYAFEDAHAMALKVPGDSTPHRFIAVETHCTSFALGGPPRMERVDLTCDQFTFDLDYAHATHRMFLQTGGYGPSKRARQLAELLQLERKRA
jgi:hypothetical protein